MLAKVNVEIVKRCDHVKGFVVLPKRWVVERTFAWLGRCRRLAKDWECLSRRPRLPPSRIDPFHAAKIMQSSMIFPDRLLEAVREPQGFTFLMRTIKTMQTVRVFVIDEALQGMI